MDEVAAAHADADCVLHLGRSCLSPVSQLPTLLLLPRRPLDCDHCAAQLAQHAQEACSAEGGARYVLVFLDQAHAADQPSLLRALESSHPQQAHLLRFAPPPPTELEPALPAAACGSCGCERSDSAPPPPPLPEQPPPPPVPQDCAPVWVGASNAALLLLLLSLPLHPSGSAPLSCAHYCPRPADAEPSDPPGEWRPSAASAPLCKRLLGRRYAAVERARGARIVGLVAGTLGVRGFAAALDRLRVLVREGGRKSYTLLVGKPSPAKLGNFPECDAFVLVGCPGSALLDARQFDRPLLTSFEAQLAFAPPGQGEWTPGAYRTDLSALPFLPSGATEEEVEEGLGGLQLSLRGERALGEAGGASEVACSADFLTLRRSFQGMPAEAPQEGDRAVGVVAGLSGRAAVYAGEKTAAARA